MQDLPEPILLYESVEARSWSDLATWWTENPPVMNIVQSWGIFNFSLSLVLTTVVLIQGIHSQSCLLQAHEDQQKDVVVVFWACYILPIRSESRQF
jgi:hypothetical protein